MRDTLADIQNLRDADLADELSDEFDAALEDESEDSDADDTCDNCFAAGVPISQTCPECGRTLCADCAAEAEDGFCGNCQANETDTEDKAYADKEGQA